MNYCPHNPPHLCACGCGERVTVSPRNRYARGVLKGQCLSYLKEHAGRSRIIEPLQYAAPVPRRPE